MIFVRNLKKAFGSHAVLTGLDLSIGAGAITLMVGANGAGKTTTMRLLAGLADADDGTIAIAGHDLRRARAKAVGALSFLPQAPRFHPRLTVAQVARFHGELRGGHRDAIERALDRWGLREHASVPTAKLSGGLRQRLALAVFDLADAQVRLLDEPGLSLDPAWREHLQNFLLEEAARGKTVLVATHLLGEWNGRADRCVLIAGGRFAEDVPPDRLRDRLFPLDAHSSLVVCAA
jgi:ABC-type multidrug transport system ATPase subunit